MAGFLFQHLPDASCHETKHFYSFTCSTGSPTDAFNYRHMCLADAKGKGPTRAFRKDPSLACAGISLRRTIWRTYVNSSYENSLSLQAAMRPRSRQARDGCRRQSLNPAVGLSPAAHASPGTSGSRLLKLITASCLHLRMRSQSCS